MQEQGGPLWLAISQNTKGEGDILTLAFEEHRAQIKFDIVSPPSFVRDGYHSSPNNSAAIITLQNGAKQGLRNGLQGFLLGSC